MLTDPPGPSRSELAREVLLFRMKEYSEEFHCAGWLSGLEFLLWETPVDDDDSRTKFLRPVVLECHTLAEISGGWWVYQDKTRPGEPGPVFVSMDRWKEILADRKSSP